MDEDPGCITLAIPNFNGAKFLEETLRSLCANGDAVRWWLQDGCSTDTSLEIAGRYARPCDIIRTEPDTGQVDALNRALGRMGGEIIGFINSDDCLLADAARCVLEIFRAEPGVDLVYGEVEWIDENSDSTGFHSGDISSLEEVLDIYGVWWNRRQWVQPEVFFRRSLWERVGAFNTSYQLAFDYEYWTRCFRAGARVRKLPRRLARFRRHARQKSVNATQAAREIRAILAAHLANMLPDSRRRRLQMRLDYDVYQSGGHGPVSPQFESMLAKNPGWLLVPEVRQRLWQSITRRLRLK